MKRRATSIAILSCLLALCAAVKTRAQQFDISSGGPPTITGAQGGTVTGTSDLTQDLIVTINFGEVSPVNSNNIVKVVVPVGIRSNAAYKVTATVAGAFNANPQSVQPSDIGFGVLNMRQMGNKSQDCSTPHIFYAPFNNDPSSSVTINASGRAAYPSSLQTVAGSTTLLSGPRLTKGNVTKHEADNGYIFDAVFTIKPQYYVSGTFSATITFNISSGPNVICN